MQLVGYMFYGVVCLSVGRYVSWSRSWSLQKRQMRSRCRSECWLQWA